MAADGCTGDRADRGADNGVTYAGIVRRAADHLCGVLPA
jgi:hypothetical protein